ncbi:MAG: MBL fold metallo-hydrolase [Calditrichaeota bacterium]|nr:MAG: MBL fold metallo-hydrolase [Calditrichota bacterium]
MKKFTFLIWFLTLPLFLIATEKPSRTKLVLLGTGTPNPDPERSGCSVAIVVDDKSYIIDMGPGLVRQAAAMSPNWGGNIEALTVKNLDTVFLTHLHSDHTVGFADLLLTPWVLERDAPLKIYGPEGTKNMAEHILAAYQADIKYRLYGLEPANNQGWRIEVQEIDSGLVYRDDLVKVEAFAVTHGSWPNAFGFRFTTPDKVIVISGDTTPSKNLEKYAQNADILLHEVYHKKSWDNKPPFWKKYHKRNHTSTLELGEIAARAKPALLVLYHILFWEGNEQDLLDEISQTYDGKVIVGADLMVID